MTPGQTKTQRQTAILALAGEEEVFERYLETGSMRAMLASYGITTIKSFYDFLALEEGRRGRWDEVLSMRGQLAADRVLEIAEGTTDATVQTDRLKLAGQQWVAERFNTRFGKNANLNVQVTSGEAWLAALESIEEAEWALAEEAPPAITAGEEDGDE